MPQAHLNGRMNRIDRPLVWMLSAFLLGLLLCAVLSLRVTIPLLCAILCAATGVFLFVVKKRLNPLATGCLLLAAGLILAAFLSFTRFETYRSESARFDGVQARVEGVASDVSHTKLTTVITLTDVRIDGTPIESDIRLTTYQAAFRNMPIYARVSAKVLLEKPKDLLYGFDFENYLFSRGISLVANMTNGRFQENDDLPFLAKIQGFQEILGSYLDISSADEVKALLLGDTSSADEVLEEEMRVIGVSHIYSISGLHLTLLLSSIYHLLFRLRVPRVANTGALVLFSLFYMVITGFAPSVCRAGIMAMLFYIALAVRRQSDGLTSLLFATACICIVNPFSICHTGLQLSFLATLGIFTIGERCISRFLIHSLFSVSRPRVFCLSAYLKWGGKWLLRSAAELLIINLTATVVTLPIILIMTNEVSLISPLANLLLVPLFNPILICSAIYLVCRLCIGFILPVGTVFSFLSEICGYLIEGLFFVFRGLVHFFASMDFAIVFTNYPFLPIVILVFILILSVCIFQPRLTRFYPLLPLLFVGVFLFSWGIYTLTASGDTVMYKISVRTDDKLIVCEEGTFTVLEGDCLGNTLSSQTKNTLMQNGVEKVYVYVLPDLCESDVKRVEALASVCPVERVLVPEEKCAGAQELLLRLSDTGAAVATYRYAQDIPLKSSVLRVYPCGNSDVWYVWENGEHRVCYGGKWAEDIHLLPEPQDRYDLLFLSGKVSGTHPLFYTAAYTAFKSTAMEEADFLAAQKDIFGHGGNLFDMAEHKIAKATLGESVTLSG